MGNEHSVVINHEEQYSVWPADREPPVGWKAVGKRGDRETCRAFIEQVWKELQPMSVRRRQAKMDEMEALVRRDARR